MKSFWQSVIFINQSNRFYCKLKPHGKLRILYDNVEFILCEDTVQKPAEPPPASDSSLHYKVPNVISPNGDGLNDAFVLESRGVKEVSVKVYNRWGEEVVSRKVSGISTDVVSKTIYGMLRTTRATRPRRGVYYYLVELSTKNGEVIIEKGNGNGVITSPPTPLLRRGEGCFSLLEESFVPIYREFMGV
ncbi:MAG: hypothetical protein KatS3mg027_1881 [Bacteroidia bacterium]|nr:MAG: hypothetical protein KatS3mg027_1881 [Bacteroidia bacterium]